MTDRAVFEAQVLPHLDAAYNLARWLTRDPHDAEDVVQEACVRALRYLPAFSFNALRAARQAKNAAGNLAASLLADARFAFWTRTLDFLPWRRF